MLVYPNPTGGLIEIEHPANAKKISILDVHGKNVMTKPASGGKSTTLDIRQVATGVYFIRIDNLRVIRLYKK